MKIKRKDNKRKSNLTFKLLYLLLISLLVVNYSIARYRSTYNTSASGNAAKFVFKTNVTEQANFKLSLADTALESKYVDRSKRIIAPGSKGKLQIDIDSTDSKVSIDYSIDMSATDIMNIPDEIEFYILDNEEKIPIVETRDKEYNISGTRTLEQIQENPIKTIYLCWEWKVNKEIEESIYEGKTFNINMTITGKQHLDS